MDEILDFEEGKLQYIYGKETGKRLTARGKRIKELEVAKDILNKVFQINDQAEPL